MRQSVALAALLVALAAAPLSAQSPGSGAPSTLSLSSEQRQAVLDSNTEDTAQAARLGIDGGAPPGRQIHGEIGAMIGTNGMRGAYGAAAIPLGDRASAAVSFEQSRFGRYR